MHLRRHRSIPIALLLLIVAAALLVRIWPWWHAPLWLDEAYSAYAADKGFAFLWGVVPRYETHPPFYYSLVRLWTLVAGDSVLALRTLGYAAAALGIIGIAAATREIARALRMPSAGLALAAAALAAASPMMIEMAREVRPYPLMILAYAVGIAAAVRLGAQLRAGGRMSRATLALYLAALAATMWLHNLGVLFGAALVCALGVLALRPRLAAAEWIALIVGHLIVAAAYVPALLILADQAPTWMKSTWLRFDPSALDGRLSYLYAAPGDWGALVAILLAGAGAVALVRRRHGWRFAAALLVTAILPVAIAVAVSIAIAPIFIVRVVSPAAVPAIVLIAFGAVGLPGRWRWAGLALGVVLLGQMAHYTVRNWPPPPRQDWYGALRWIAPQVRAGDVVLAYPNEGALPFDYAARDLGLPFRADPVPGPIPTIAWPGGWYPTGSRGVVSLPRAQLRAIARRPAHRAAGTVWLLRLGPWAYDKGDVFLDELARGRVKARWWRRGPIDIIGLRQRGISHPAAPAAAAAAR